MFVIDVKVMFNLQVTPTTMKFLPVVSLFLLSWSGTTFADQDGALVVEGSDVILPCSLSTKENIELKVFTWITDGQKEVFSYNAGIHSNNGLPGQVEQFKGRVSYFPDELKNGDASITITDTMVADSGNYSCVFQHLQSETRHIQLVVRPLVVRVVEGSDVILPCSLSTKEDITMKLFDWKKDPGKEGRKEVFLYDAGIHYNNGRPGQDEQFKGRVSHFEDELKNGNASIKITKTQVADGGNYTCVFPNLQPKRSFLIQLVVEPILKDRSEENTGAAPKPYIKILDQTEDSALLQCEVHGASPKPKVEWWDSSGNILPAKEPKVSERGGSYDIILQTTVTKTDNYSCVATQEEINHQTHADTFVRINGAAPKPYITILGQTEDGVLLQCEVQGASPKPQLQWQDSSGNILPAKEPKVSERGGSYDIILQTTVTKTDTYSCVATQEEINHQTHAETFVPVNGFSTGWIVAAVVVVVLLLLVVLVAVLCFKLKKGSSVV